MFIKVVDTIVTQEIEPEVEDEKSADRVIFSKVKQSKYDVLYGDSLQRPTGERK